MSPLDGCLSFKYPTIHPIASRSACSLLETHSDLFSHSQCQAGRRNQPHFIWSTEDTVDGGLCSGINIILTTTAPLVVV